MMVFQSTVTFWAAVQVRIEFGTVSIFFFVIMVEMIVASFKLFSLMEEVIGKDEFRQEISTLKRTLHTFSVCFVVGIVRNVLVTYYWPVCVTVH